MATTAPPRGGSILRVPPIRDYGAPAWFERLPAWVRTGGVLVFFLAVSAFIRLHYVTGQLWSEEANTVGIASHSLTAIPGILWQGGGAPLYFLLEHVWISAFGGSEPSVHALPVLAGLLTIPVGTWLAWGLFGRRAGYLAAALFAFNGFLTQFAEEARPYELMVLLGLLATGSFLHAFVYRRRRWYLPLFGLSLVLLAYTDYWGFFFWAATAVALVPVWLRSEDRSGVARDALLCFGVAALVFVPWIPTLIHQIGSSTAPWRYVPLPGANVPRKLFGTDRVVATMAIAVVAGLVPLLSRRLRRTPEAMAALVLIMIPAVALALALLAWLVVPDWEYRLFAPIVAPLLLLCALASARSNILGLVLVIVSCAFLANPASFISTYKSDMRDVSGELAPYLRPADAVLVAQPEQAPLAWYYLPSGVRYFTMFGQAAHPSYTNWDAAMSRLQGADPARLAARVVSGLKPGQHLLFIRPLTEGEINWSQSWTTLVRRRAAQLGAALAADRRLVRVGRTFAPHYYRGSCCLASSALLYVKR